MKRMEQTGILGCFAILLIVAFAWTAPIPDILQTKKNDAGDEITRQLHDTYVSKSSTSYTRLDDTGKALSEYASSWSMVRDNVTGLIWEMKTNKDGVKNYSDPHDADNTYSWYDNNPATNGGYEGTQDKGKDTRSFLEALNNAGFGGYTDWRLPTLKELNSIVDYDVSPPGPTISSTYFPNTQASFYWSSSASVGYDYRAWCVGFDDGYAHDYGKYGYYYVRAVRGSQTGGPPNTKDGGQYGRLDKISYE